MTNAIAFNPDQNLTMTSREIADLADKRHDNVMRDIRAMLVELHGEVGVLSFEDTHTNPQNGQSYPVFKLPKRETLILVSGYSVALRAKIIDRWQELEAQASNPAVRLPNFNDPAIAARAWADEVEQKQAALVQAQQATQQLALAAPKAEALDKLTLSDGALCLTNAAKVLGVQPKRFFAWLQEHQWIYRRSGGAGYTGYQARIQVGYLDHKVTVVSRSDGTEKTCEQVLVTPKGLAKLSQALAQAEAA